MLLHLECQTCLLQHHADVYIERFSSLSSLFVVFSINSKLRVVCVLYPASLIFLVFFYIYTFFYECLIQFIQQIEFTGQVHHRACFTFLVDHEQRRNACCTSYVRIVRTKSRSDMYDTRTIFGSYIVARNDTERLSRSLFPASVFGCFNRFYPRNQLFVLHAYQVCTFIFAHNLERNQLVTRFVVFQRHAFCLLVEMSVKQRFGKNHSHLVTIVSIVSLYGYVVNLRAYTKSSIRRQCPRSCGPCDKIRCTPFSHFRLRVLHLKLSYDRKILHVAVTSRLVQLVRAQSGTGSR